MKQSFPVYILLSTAYFLLFLVGCTSHPSPQQTMVDDRYLVYKEMEKAYPLSVPLKSDYGWGKNWLEAH